MSSRYYSEIIRNRRFLNVKWPSIEFTKEKNRSSHRSWKFEISSKFWFFHYEQFLTLESIENCRQNLNLSPRTNPMKAMTSSPSIVYHISTRYLVTLRHCDLTETSNIVSRVSPGIVRWSVTCILRVGGAVLFGTPL